MLTKTQQLQKLVDEIPALAGYKVEYRRPAFYLRHEPRTRPDIYLNHGKLAVKWLGLVKSAGLTGHDAMRRQK